MPRLLWLVKQPWHRTKRASNKKTDINSSFDAFCAPFFASRAQSAQADGVNNIEKDRGQIKFLHKKSLREFKYL